VLSMFCVDTTTFSVPAFVVVTHKQLERLDFADTCITTSGILKHKLRKA